MTRCKECRDAITVCDDDCGHDMCDVPGHNNAGSCPDCGAQLCVVCEATHLCPWEEESEL